MKIDTDLVRKKAFVSSIKPSNLKFSQEYKVLAILRYLYPQRFGSMMKGESPDFQDATNDTGIEVISAVKENDMLVSRAFSDLCQGKPKNKEKSKKKIAENGYSILPIQGNKVAISTAGTADGEKAIFQKSIRNKAKKLQQYRTNFKKIGLAILLPEIPTSYAEEHFSEWIEEVLNKSENLFDFVYVLSHRFCIYYVPEENVSEKRLLTDEEYRSLSTIARMTAEGELSLTDTEWL